MGDDTAGPKHGRLAATLDRVEAAYLIVLRAGVLLVATLLLFWAAGWAALSLSRVVRSPSSVVETPSVVAPAELLTKTASKNIEPTLQTSTNSAEQRSFYDNFARRYYALYKTRFEGSLRRDDKRIDRGEFDDLTIVTGERLAAIRDGRLDFFTDRADLETFLPVITQAAGAPETSKQLARYRTAQKRQVTERVQRTRTESRRGWDSLSTSCSYWYETPIGCAVTRRVEVPYTERVSRMRYPDGISSPIQVLKDYQDRYFALLADRRRTNSATAENERQDILMGQIAGWSGLTNATLVAGGFLALMFFFLLIAIERHQRRLSRSLSTPAP